MYSLRICACSKLVLVRIRNFRLRTRLRWSLLSGRTFSLESDEGSGLTDTGLYDDDEPLSTRTDFRDLQNYLSLPQPSSRHRLYVIQPKLSTPELKRLATTNEDLQVEAVQLVKSVPSWTVSGINESFVKVSPKTRFIFGSGKLEELKAIVRRSRDCSAIFLNIDRLTPLQHRSLISVFGVPVFDRYALFLALYAHQRQLKMKEKLKATVAQRNILRQNAQRRRFPIVAVVGYTNCGKTSLIRCLSENANLSGEDRFFATLDVTVHSGKLPCKLSILYADTVGFFSNLPMDLMPCFNSTLEEITYADLVIHVIDRSNPNWQFQRQSVIHTFDQLNAACNLHMSPLEVWNKSDKFHLETEDDKPTTVAVVSCLSGDGMAKLLTLIEDRILKTTMYKRFVLRIPITGGYLSSLYSIGSIVSTETSQENDHMCVTLVSKRYHIDKLLGMYPNVIEVMNESTTTTTA
ncbi:GTP binding protein 6 [Trichuris trichiura]|uniref:GTP binding protein 6 n=1 Tax=Trichuris trichiura TaxID=36087 RepID=A0A077Z9N5_TRITR|nr:GTP binding protein 6 [Trichuris trichiura]